MSSFYVLALNWNDVEFENEILDISKTVCFISVTSRVEVADRFMILVQQRLHTQTGKYL